MTVPARGGDDRGGDRGSGPAVAEALDRARRLDPALCAFLDIDVDTGHHTDHDRGSAQAGRPLLAGLPITVKGRRGARHPAVRPLLDAGAVVIGTTSVPVPGTAHQTWGHTERGPTRNPWRADLSPGGSSAGAAVAVAAGIVALSCGSDGAGSVRIPAAWCHVIGYKPTTGRVPTTDPGGLAVPGVLVRDPALLRSWADAIVADWTGRPGPAPASAVWSASLGHADRYLDAEVVAVAERAAQRLTARAGLALSRQAVALPDPGPVWRTVRGPDPGRADRERADRTRRAHDRRLAALFATTDLLMTPTTPGRPHGHDGPGDHLSVALTWGFNLSGHPAVSVPAGFTDDGCPVGLQIVARPGADERLLRFVDDHVPPAPIAPAPVAPPGRGAAPDGRPPRGRRPGP